MCPGGPLALRVDAAGDAVVAGLSVHKVVPRLLTYITSCAFRFVTEGVKLSFVEPGRRWAHSPSPSKAPGISTRVL